jgi:hypothetical protein
VAGGAGTTTVEFTYLPPAVTSVSPSVGSSVGGTFVTIDGVGLTSGMTVYFGDVPVIAECGGSLSCSVVTPPYPATGVANVTVVIDGLRSATSAADQFTFLYEPAATSVGSTASTWWTGETVTGTITLNEEAPSGGTQVALSVTSNTAQAAGVTVPAAVTVPAGATSVQFPITIGAVASASVSIAATTTGGSSATSWSIYTGDIAVVQGTAFGVPSSSTTDLTVLLRDPPGASGGTLSVTSSGTAITVPSSPMSVAAGAGSLSVPIVSRSVTAATPVTVTLGYEGNTEVLQVTVEPPLKPLPPPPPPHCVGLCQ